MPSTFTPNYNLEIPGYDEQDETWGATMGANLTAIDAALEALEVGNANTYVQTAPPGLLGFFMRTTAPAGWIKARAGTIGNAASGATVRAASDTLALFLAWWNEFPAIAIQDSSGNPVARGVSAADDYAANRRFPVFDMRDQFARAWKDDLGGGVSGALGANQAQDLQSHSHNTDSNTSASGRGDSSTLRHFPGFGTSASPYPTSSTGGTETRPKNIALLACWKL